MSETESELDAILSRKDMRTVSSGEIRLLFNTIHQMRDEITRLRAGKHDRLEEARLTKQLMEAKQELHECRRLLRECCQAMQLLADQQAMPDDSWEATYEAARAAGGGDG